MDPELIREVSDASIFGELVFLTGAGVSLDLKQARDSTKNLPTWRQLLIELASSLGGTIAPDDLADLKSLLLVDSTLTPIPDKYPSGEMLIQAAEILDATADVRPEVVTLTRSVDGIAGARHHDMERLTPRGYITFNYDKGHEYAAQRVFDVIRSNDRSKLIGLMKSGCETPFLLKAHGCVDDATSIVLSSSSYRSLLYGNETYRSLLNFIFNRFVVVIIGFGLSDPDFDALLVDFERSFGVVPRSPIVITKTPLDALENGQRIAMQRRYGIRFLTVADYSQLPSLFQDVERRPGLRAQHLLRDATSIDRATRHAAHKVMERLSDHGRSVIKTWVLEKVGALASQALNRSNIFEMTELLYSIKRLGALSRSEADEVRRIIDIHPHYEPPAIGLLALQEYYPDNADRKAYEAWLQNLDARVQQLSSSPEQYGFTNFPERHAAYLETLRIYVKAKLAKSAVVI